MSSNGGHPSAIVMEMKSEDPPKDSTGTIQEPAAAMTLVARPMRDMFVALQREGFTEAQALGLVGQWMVAMFNKASNNG